jgi:hypothetical protein
LTDAKKSSIQVQLANRVFFVVKVAGRPWAKEDGSPNTSWAKHPTLEEAWNAAVSKVGGWTPL